MPKKKKPFLWGPWQKLIYPSLFWEIILKITLYSSLKNIQILVTLLEEKMKKYVSCSDFLAVMFFQTTTLCCYLEIVYFLRNLIQIQV